MRVFLQLGCASARSGDARHGVPCSAQGVVGRGALRRAIGACEGEVAANRFPRDLPCALNEYSMADTVREPWNPVDQDVVDGDCLGRSEELHLVHLVRVV